VLILVVGAFLANATQIFNRDIFHLLASGQWMVENGQILTRNIFTAGADQNFFNAHWLFELVLWGVHAVGGFTACSLLKALLAAGILAVAVWPLRKKSVPALLLTGGLLLILILVERCRVRAESFSYLFLAITLAVLESARQTGRTGRLWWLVPVFIVWVNMQSLFMVGLGIVLAAVGGAWLDRLFNRSRTGSGLAGRSAGMATLGILLSCLISPWPIRTLLHPLGLFTRISGQQVDYRWLVSEFRPIWYDPHALPYALSLILMAVTGLVLILNARRVPMGHWIWAAATGYLAVTAVRNVALMAVLFAYLLILHGSSIVNRHDLTLARLLRSRPMSALALAITLATIITFPFGHILWAPKKNGPPGLGLDCSAYPIIAAKTLARLDVPGNILSLNFGDSGAFTYFTGPLTAANRKVYLTGWGNDPVKIVTLQKLNDRLREPKQHDTLSLPSRMPFLFAGQKHAAWWTVLSHSPRFGLLVAEPFGATFYDRQQLSDKPSHTLTTNLADLDRPLDDDLRFAPRADLFPDYRWDPQICWPPLVRVLENIGRPVSPPLKTPSLTRARCTLLAIRYAMALRAVKNPPTPIDDVIHALRILPWSHFCRLPLSDGLPVDLHAAQFRYLLRQSGYWSEKLIDHLDQQIIAARQLRGVAGDTSFPRTRQQRQALLGQPIGNQPTQRIRRIDTLLASGLIQQARTLCDQSRDVLPRPQIELRLALAETITGNPGHAIRQFRQLGRDGLVSGWLYHGLVCERTGRYDQALPEHPLQTEDPALQAALQDLRHRLETWRHRSF
jgi:hypothetical protein